MHIAYLASLYPYASDTYVRNEVDALRAAGWQVSAFAVRRPPDHMLVDERIREEAARTEYLLTGGLLPLCLAVVWAASTRPLRLGSGIRLVWATHAPGLRNRLKQLAYVAEAAVLAKRLLQKGIRHLHNHVAENSATVAMLASHLSGIPFSMTVHGPGIFFHPRQWGLGEKVRRSAFTVCISEYCRSQCMVFTPPRYWSHLQVVRCGLGRDFLNEAPSLPPELPRFVCVGRLCSEKGHTILLEAVRNMVRAGRNVEVVVIGDGPLRAELEQKCRQGHLEGHIRFLGWQTTQQVRKYINESRGLIVSSFAEGLPIVLMEAMAMQRPVIATQIAGVPELVENGVNGWLVPPGSVEALVQAMEQMLQTPVEKLTEMGRCGREKILREHHAATEAAKLAQLFQETLQSI